MERYVDDVVTLPNEAELGLVVSRLAAPEDVVVEIVYTSPGGDEKIIAAFDENGDDRIGELAEWVREMLAGQ